LSNKIGNEPEKERNCDEWHILHEIVLFSYLLFISQILAWLVKDKNKSANQFFVQLKKKSK